MPRIARKHLQQAEDRGIVQEGTTEELRPVNRRRICPACGESFLPAGPGHKGFCDSWCAYTWGLLLEQGKLDRTLARDIEVVVYETGRMGVIISIPSVTEILVRVDGDDEPTLYQPFEVNRIQYLVVDKSAQVVSAVAD